MRHKNTLVVMAIAVLFVACSDNASGSDDGRGPTTDTVEDTGAEDSSHDVGPDTSDVLDAASDAEGTPDGDTSDVDAFDPDAVDAGPEAYTCSCPTEGDECVIILDGELICIDPASRQSPCEKDEDCASGYTCNVVTELCECDPEQRGDECFVTCDQDACPRFHQCGPGGRCEPPQKCLSDTQCKSGESCVTIDTPEEFRTNDDEWSFCAEGGDKAPGEICNSDVECASGTCRADEWVDGAWQFRCARRCLSDDDCVVGQRCDAHDGICLSNAEAPECKVDCPGDRVCSATHCGYACRNSADCPKGDCIVSPDLDINVGTCSADESGLSSCKPGEVRVHFEDPFCRLATADCSDDEDCPPDYECVNNAVYRFRPPRPHLCSRRVTDGPWPLERP